jgi:hypothetical protein
MRVIDLEYVIAHRDAEKGEGSMWTMKAMLDLAVHLQVNGYEFALSRVSGRKAGDEFHSHPIRVLLVRLL